LLYKLREELADAGAAQPLPDPPAFALTAQHERFNRPVRDLDRVLTDYGISPHPSLVVALEGATEIILVGKSMEHLHVPRRRSYIELFDMGGNTRDYGLLASYAAVPDLGEPLQPDLVRLDRPLTRFMIVTDPENTLQTAADREAKRQKVVGAIFAKLPPAYQTQQARGQLDSLVAIETWTGTESFEFAHFSNSEISTAIRRAYRRQGRAVPAVTAAQVAAVRQKRGNLKSLLKALPPPAVKKDQMAEALWPALRRKLDRRVRQGSVDKIPVGRILQRAVELGTMSFRRGAALNF
jgi:hypothetical protein